MIIIFYGFVFALCTDFILGKKEINKLPGGSIIVGFAVAAESEANLILGAIGGLLGWCLYLLFKRFIEWLLS